MCIWTHRPHLFDLFPILKERDLTWTCWTQLNVSAIQVLQSFYISTHKLRHVGRFYFTKKIPSAAATLENNYDRYETSWFAKKNENNSSLRYLSIRHEIFATKLVFTWTRIFSLFSPWASCAFRVFSASFPWNTRGSTSTWMWNNDSDLEKNGQSRLTQHRPTMFAITPSFQPPSVAFTCVCVLRGTMLCDMLQMTIQCVWCVLV